MTEPELTTLAHQHGLTLRRSTVTDPAVPGYGIYWLHDATTDLLVFPDRWGATIQKIKKLAGAADPETPLIHH